MGTTVLCVRKGDKVVVIGDGQVTLGSQIIKPNVKKVRQIGDSVIGGFAGICPPILSSRDYYSPASSALLSCFAKLRVLLSVAFLGLVWKETLTSTKPGISRCNSRLFHSLRKAREQT